MEQDAGASEIGYESYRLSDDELATLKSLGEKGNEDAAKLYNTIMKRRSQPTEENSEGESGSMEDFED